METGTVITITVILFLVVFLFSQLYRGQAVDVDLFVTKYVEKDAYIAPLIRVKGAGTREWEVRGGLDKSYTINEKFATITMYRQLFGNLTLDNCNLFENIGDTFSSMKSKGAESSHPCKRDGSSDIKSRLKTTTFVRKFEGGRYDGWWTKQAF